MNLKAKTTSELHELLKWAREKIGNRYNPPNWGWINTLETEIEKRSKTAIFNKGF